MNLHRNNGFLPSRPGASPHGLRGLSAQGRVQRRGYGSLWLTIPSVNPAVFRGHALPVHQPSADLCSSADHALGLVQLSRAAACPARCGPRAPWGLPAFVPVSVALMKRLRNNGRGCSEAGEVEPAGGAGAVRWVSGLTGACCSRTGPRDRVHLVVSARDRAGPNLMALSRSQQKHRC